MAVAATAVLALALLLRPPAGKGEVDDLALWQAYRGRFVAADGRVIDTGNGRVTHSEGQGWGMLLAEAFGDRETFERIWSWTRDTLQWRGSHLFAWRYDPKASEPIGDPNNATDGDLLIAWALARAGERWNDAGYREAARRIAGDVRELLVAHVRAGPVLLPGFEGFDADRRLILNLSYYVFPAFAALERVDPSPQWAAIRREGMALLGRAQFGRWGLPPDWVAVGRDGQVAPAPDRPPRFGYEAIRIPLYLVWSGEASRKILAPYRAFRESVAEDAELPGWTALDRDASADYPASTGFRAVLRLVERTLSRRSAAPLPAIGEGDDYYSASLTLLVRLAAREAPGSRL